MSEITIRKSRAGDGAGCARLWRELGAFFASLDPRGFQVPAAEGLAEWLEGVIATIAADEAQLHLIAEADGVPVGSLSAKIHEPAPTAERQVQADLSRRQLHIDSLGVAASHRRSGVGGALMRAAEEWGRAKGAQIMLLETEPTNPTSMPFYEHRMGMSVQAVILRKELTA
jgi:ribosomal protein S18 acetylase RimI-like enzyme